MVFILLRSTPMVTSVWAIFGDNPVMMTLAPMSRDASTVCTRWFATVWSTSGRTRDVDDDDLGAVLADAGQQLLGQLAGPVAVEHADDGQDEQSLAHREHGRRQLADGVLLLSDDPLALVDEADRHGVGDPVRSGLVGVEHLVEQGEVALVLLEE